MAWALALVASAGVLRAEESDGEEEPEEQEVVVSGERPHPTTAPRDRGVSGSVIPRQRLTVPGTDAAEALRESPGVQITRLGGLGAQATVLVRGATAAQTPVYLAGMRLNDEVGGVANLADLPLFLIDRIEVYRSHAPREASSLGIGGAIFLEPRRPRVSELSFGATAGSFGTRGARGHAAFREGDRSVLAGVSLEAATNDYPFYDSRGTLFVDEDGGVARLQNADASQRSVWLLASDRLEPAEVQVLLHHAAREQGAPKLALVPTESARASFSRDLFVLRSDLPVAAWNGSISLRASGLQAVTVLDDPQNELGLGTPFSSTPGERLEQVFEARQQLARRLTLVQQLSVSAERLRRYEGSVGRRESRLAARRFALRGALSAEWALTENLSLSALGAVRCFDTSTTTLGACEDVAPSGRVGALYRLGAVDVYGNLGRYYRLPTLSELYGASLLVRGSDRLSPEEGESAELGARFQVSRPGQPTIFWIDLAGFARSSRDLITYVRTAQGYLRPVNRDTARTLGSELAVGARPFPGVVWEGHVSWLDARDTSSTRTTANDVLPFISRATAFVRGRYEHVFGGDTVDRAAFGASYVHQSSRYADPAGLGVIPAQGFVDLEAEVTALSGVLVGRVRVSNLFDSRRFDVVGFPLPGRSFFFSSEVTW